MTDLIVVQTTTETSAEAHRLAALLVEQRLAACAQVHGPIVSRYWWQGRLEQAEEWVCAAKTLAGQYAAVERALRSAHSYDEPQIIALPVTEGSAGYLRWVEQTVNRGSADQ